MRINRRHFLERVGILSTALALPGPATAAAHGISAVDEIAAAPWRTFEVTTRIEVLNPAGSTRVWAPAALFRDTPFQKTLHNTVQCDAGTIRTFKNPSQNLEVVAAEFPAGAQPVLTLISLVKTRNWSVDLAARSRQRRVSRSGLQIYLRPTKLMPTDGIVRLRALEITKGTTTDVDKARAIYQWIVENTWRDPKTRGCGRGEIRHMLESGDLGGKCADLNGLYVGLARAVGLPARDVYGIRVAPAQMGCKSLGVSSGDITRAQHCRAEVYLSDYGWIPVDPADVRKVILEEPPGNRALQDQLVEKARTRLFGSWEMNWMAYNYAQTVALPGSRRPAIHFLMYPQAETAEGRLDSLDPTHFRYQITSRELTSSAAAT